MAEAIDGKMTARLDFSGTKVFVTGGTRGIGRAIALEFAKCGASVAVNYLRNKEAAKETLGALQEYGHEHIMVKGNVADPDKVDRMEAEIRQAWGEINVLVSNAASGVSQAGDGNDNETSPLDDGHQRRGDSALVADGGAADARG